MKYLVFLTIATFVFTSQSCYYENQEELYADFIEVDCDITDVSYTNDVVATLTQYCYACHNTQNAPTLGAGIELNTYQQVKVYVDNERLYGTIAHLSGFSPMPQGSEQIPQCDQDMIKAWIDEGALNN